MSTSRLEGRLILIVDDDEDVLSSIDLAMRSEGARTIKVTDGSAALHEIQHGDPDAIVLDMMLPKASGFLVLEKMIELEVPPPVVMVTANQGRRHMAYAESLGVSAYLSKPVSLTHLVDTVCDIIDRAERFADDDATGDED
ncbi:MAG: response regulator [Planctomycetota bacterium]